MKKVTNLVLLLMLSVAFSGCNTGNKEKQTETAENETKIAESKNSNELTIKGNEIWVRSEPSTGKVVMKLNDGDKCKIIEKGEKEQIRGMVDYWYKISYDGKEGWVFGSQTNLKTDEQPVLENFSNFLTSFISKVKQKKEVGSFIHPQVGVAIGKNPGAICSSIPGKTTDIKIPENLPNSNLFNREPKGDYCEGFPNEKSGFYYIEITKDELPSFGSYTEAGGITTKKISIPSSLNSGKFYKVIIIDNASQHSIQYFTSIDFQWYIICQSFCDCSA